VEIQSVLQFAAGAIGIIAYLVLVTGLIKTKAEQSFAAFLLWALLDLIATITSVLSDGNYWLPMSNAIGSSVIAVLLIVKKQVSWSRIESMTVILVIICLIVWYADGDRAGIIASSLAVVLASVPQMVETYRKPEATPVSAYLVFLFANVISFSAGESWTIEERFYAGCSIFLCLVIVIFALRKRRNPHL
jgi:hypothetical protein